MPCPLSQVFLSHRAFHELEDRLRADEGEDDLGRHIEHAGSGDHAYDPFSPHRTFSGNGADLSPPLDKYDASPYGDNPSSAALPLVAHAQGFRDQVSDDGYDDRKGIPPRDDRYISKYGDSLSNIGTEAYAPSRNMFQNLDRKGADHDEKDGLTAQPAPGETVEEVRESAARKRWVALCWLLTWWIPSFILKWFSKLKRPDIRQAWREKLTINLIIWFICGCTIFVIAILGRLICPTQHVYSTGELAAHSYANQPNNAFVAIRGEVSCLEFMDGKIETDNYLFARSLISLLSLRAI